MNAKWTILVSALAAGLTPEALPASDHIIQNPTGSVRIQLDLPVLDDVDQTTAIVGGRIELAPSEGVNVPGGKRFTLTQMGLRFADFTINRTVVVKTSTQPAVQLVTFPTFVATPVSPGVYAFSIPADQVLLYGTSFVNGALEADYDQPRDPVTGTINLNNGTVTATTVVYKRQHVDLVGTVQGPLTLNLTGTLGPDSDGDLVRDSVDNCRLVPNVSQTPVASPLITAPGDVTFASCGPQAIGTATGRDLCDGRPVTVTSDAPASYARGTTVVAWKATDSRGRQATATQYVTVIDQTPPRFTTVPPRLAVEACGSVAIGQATAADDCGAVVVSSNAPATFGPGSTLVIWSARDAAGNGNIAGQLVTVDDDTPPVFTSVPPDVTLTTCVGADIGRPVAADSCGVTVTHDAPAKFPLGETTVVTWTAADGAGNRATTTQRVSTELGDDPSCCPSGTHIILGTDARDVLHGTSGSDCILGRGGDDLIEARDGGDFLAGGDGRDVIQAGPGRDLVYGREGDDVLVGGPGDDRLDGGPGRDTCNGAVGVDVRTSCEAGPKH